MQNSCEEIVFEPLDGKDMGAISIQMAERGDHSKVSLPELILMRQADNEEKEREKEMLIIK